MKEKINRTIQNKKNLAILIALLILVFAGLILAVHKYAPTNERMSLSDFFVTSEDDEVSVINNGVYEEPADNEVDAVLVNGVVYIEIDYLKSKFDEGYVYDATEHILRYTTAEDVYSASIHSQTYTIGRQVKDLGHDVFLEKNQTAYIAMDFVNQLTDVTYQSFSNPNRVVIWGAGTKQKTAMIRRDTAIRRFGGPKSKILADVPKGEQIVVVETYGRWSQVLTKDGKLGCLKNSALKDEKNTKVKATLAKQTYQHILMDDTVNLLWHQVTTGAANSSVNEILATSKGVNVLCPTWFDVSDNHGGVASIASMDYVNTCHSNNIEVWGLITNVDNTEVDLNSVLNTTSSRDNLINNIVADAIAYNLDGINIDFESLSASAADGYMEFYRELSLKCEKNDLVLSVCNYVPSSSTAFYNRDDQSEYADYVIVMAYDEYYRGSDEAGSNASIDFVKDGIKNTLSEVPAKQVILGMPFYARIWASDGTNLTSQTIGMNKIEDYLKKHNASTTWLKDEGQNYAEFTENGKTYMLWVEDADSLALKLELVNKNHLAGGAFWKAGFEPESIWSVISNYLK